MYAVHMCVFSWFPVFAPSCCCLGAEGNPQQHPERVSVDLQHGDLITMEAELKNWGVHVGVV